MDPSLIIAALVGSGGTGLVPLVWKMVRDRRGDKAEDAKTLGAQLESQALRDMHRANAAEVRADKAEANETVERKARWAAEEYVAALRLQIKNMGVEPIEREGR